MKKKIKYYLKLIELVAKDEQLPKAARWMAGATVAYALSPLDLIPDFIPILGQLDDLLILPVMVFITIRLIPEEILERNKEKAKKENEE